ncbi:MAG: hypothetical protein FJW24_05480 [Acidimicrobiia bacterium]|nr:hypothetical protein [Acidimicrobiia bacterium]
MRPRLTKFACFLIVALFAVAGAAAASADLSPRTNAQDGVTIRAAPRAVSPSEWEFEIVFDTHSKALTDDLGNTTRLVDDGGASYVPSAWRGDPPGGHHRKGTLRFDKIAPAPAYLELRIQRAGEKSPRIFRWQTK